MFKRNFDLLNFGVGVLKYNEIPSSIREGELLLSTTLNLEHEKLSLRYNSETNYNSVKKYISIIERRTSKEPVAYILEEKEFYSNRFYVNRSVLIPRPESELIIDYILSERSSSSVIDLGVGSGNILLSIRSITSKRLYGVDNSIAALKVAKKNSLLLKCDTTVIFLSDFFKVKCSEKVQYLVSNPPYIEPKAYNALMEDVRKFEPANALLAKDGGLVYYKMIAANSKSYLLPSGKIVVEIGMGMLNEVVHIFKKENLKLLKVMDDLAGIHRTLIFGLV